MSKINTDPCSHDLSFEVFDDSTDTPCSSLGDCLLHSTPIKNSRLSSLIEPEIPSYQEDEIEAIDIDTSSGEFCFLYNCWP